MVNPIYSLDATSLCLLYHQFSAYYKKYYKEFYSVHDCFGTTCDKVATFKTILVSTFIDLYTSEPYLVAFDKCIIEYVGWKTQYKLDENRRIKIKTKNT